MKKSLARFTTYLFLLAMSAILLLPMAWMISTSLKESGLTLSHGMEWLPWQDIYASPEGDQKVFTLAARIRREGQDETREVSIKSLRAHAQFTTVYEEEGAFEAEVLAFRIRPMTLDGKTEEAFWVPFEQHFRRVMPYWKNYSEALSKMRFWDGLSNSIAVTFLGTLGTLLSCSLVAYGFARFRFPGRDGLFMVLLSTMMLPPVVTMIPVYLLFREFGWIDTLLPLIVPSWFALNAFSVFLFRQYFMTVPFDLDDAARIDGCSPFGTYWHVMLPLSRPVMATVAIFCFTAYWLDFMGPLVYLNNINKFTLTLSLYMFQSAYLTQWQYMMAATLMVSLPCILLFLFGQRYFVRGVVMSGLKG
jgi:multiple sugar transport system permease protein